MLRLTTLMSIVPPESVGKAMAVQSSSGLTQLHFHMERMTKPEKESPHQSKYFIEKKDHRIFPLSTFLPEEAAGGEVSSTFRSSQVRKWALQEKMEKSWDHPTTQNPRRPNKYPSKSCMWLFPSTPSAYRTAACGLHSPGWYRRAKC